MVLKMIGEGLPSFRKHFASRNMLVQIYTVTVTGHGQGFLSVMLIVA